MSDERLQQDITPAESYPGNTSPPPSAQSERPLQKKRIISIGRLERMIDNLKPDEELFAGKRFLRALLAERGVKGVLHFLKKAAKALAEQDGLDLAYDFDDTERRLFHSTRLNLLNRRNFLETIGWGVPGVLCLVNGVAKIGDKIVSAAGGHTEKNHEKEEKPHRGNLFHTISESVEQLGGIEYTLIGAALVNEAIEKWIENKLEHVADAVGELGKKIAAHERRRQASQHGK